MSRRYGKRLTWYKMLSASDLRFNKGGAEFRYAESGSSTTTAHSCANTSASATTTGTATTITSAMLDPHHMFSDHMQAACVAIQPQPMTLSAEPQAANCKLQSLYKLWKYNARVAFMSSTNPRQKPNLKVSHPKSQISTLNPPAPGRAVMQICEITRALGITGRSLLT